MAEGEGSRRNTVYDLTSLRLHPDGSRVQQAETKNLALGKREDVVYHPRRGWFAGDAGGKVVTAGTAVLKRKRAVSCGDDDDDGGGSGDDGGDSTVDEFNATVEVESRGRTLERKPHKSKSARAKKRRRFKEDDSFIGKLTQKLQEPGHKDDAPSADLLKGIHRLSSKFYESRGALEQVHKHKSEKKKQQKGKGKQKAEAPETPEPSQHRRRTNVQGQGHVSPTESEHEAKNEAEQDKLKKYLDSPESPTPSTNRNNAYRVFEGSLLLGLGILTQEKIARMLESKTPQRDDRKDVVAGVGAYPTPYPSSRSRYSDPGDDVFLDKRVSPSRDPFESEGPQAGDPGHVRTVSIEGWEVAVFEDDSDGYEDSTDSDKYEVNSEMEEGTTGGQVIEYESEEASEFIPDEEADDLGSENE
ncbi:hypothetical protein P691DRAFT_771564 [Macrolepiota fuliginosa MF-IS2]|uniref:Uncharacterized protein n=1 Tax=Macrolepiota fuliginosa MF-IS2 TaxID=1400762 RepID=A0A9P5XM74_9AGAR|nr:hypothetical protein P691DRAFT_771564 [Macrolepiota fuliginosa MF-IS2]